MGLIAVTGPAVPGFSPGSLPVNAFRKDHIHPSRVFLFAPRGPDLFIIRATIQKTGKTTRRTPGITYRFHCLSGGFLPGTACFDATLVSVPDEEFFLKKQVWNKNFLLNSLRY
jgi:hypothetical protein